MRFFGKNKIWKRDNYICIYCRKKCTREDVTVEHIITRQSGGTNSPDNLATACKRCNHTRGRKTQYIIYKK